MRKLKTPEEIIETVIFDSANLKHIAITGKINGSLLASFRNVIVAAQRDALECAAEHATIVWKTSVTSESNIVIL